MLTKDNHGVQGVWRFLTGMIALIIALVAALSVTPLGYARQNGGGGSPGTAYTLLAIATAAVFGFAGIASLLSFVRHVRERD